MKACLLLVIFLALLRTPAGSPAQSLESEAVAREEYAVYSVALRMLYDDFAYHPPLWVIANPTVRERDLVTRKYLSTCCPGAPIASDETFADYSQRNKTNRWLERRFDLNFKYALGDIQEIVRLIHSLRLPDDWKDFKGKYPTAEGFIRLSRVGVNARMDEALVYVSWTCGGLCGYGDVFLLAKEDRQWKVVNRLRLWVS